ncbi:MAG: DUF4261 domain-containing protein [Bacillota bacterium]
MGKERSHLLVFVLLNEPRLPDAEQIAARLAARASRYELSWEEPAGQREPNRAVQFYDLNGQRVTVGLMPVPVPWSDLEGPCATNRFWPQATEVCRAHRAHLVVMLHSEREDPVWNHLAMTHLIAALVEAVGALAVYWGAGSVVQPAELFCRWAAEASPNDLPLFLWVDFRLFAHEGHPFLATTGLTALGVMEIEGGSRRLKPSELLGRVYDLAHYACLEGPVLNDGDSIGADEQERIRIRHADSVWERPGPVIRVDFDGEERPRGLLSRLFGR